MEDDDLLGTIDASKNNLNLALRLSVQGIPVFPCREKAEGSRGEKSPATKNGFKDASTDSKVIRRWWKERPFALVGMPTGAASGFAVLDLDRHDAEKDGVKAMVNLGYRIEDMTPIRVRTAGGGIHLFFQHRDGITNRDSHLPKGVDVRAEGGYVIAPGTMFEDGRAYGSADLTYIPPLFPSTLMPPERETVDVGDQHAVGLSIEQIRDFMADLPNEGLDRDQWKDVIASLNHEAMVHNEDGVVRSDEEKEEICKIAVEWTAKDTQYSTPAHLKEARQQFWTFKNRGDGPKRTFRSIISEVNNIRAEAAMSDDDFDEMDDISPVEKDEWSEDDEDDDEDLLGTGDTARSRKLKKDGVEDALGKAAPSWVIDLNQKHAIARVSSRTVVMDFHPDRRVTYGNVGDLHAYYENRRVDSDGKTVPITKKWMQHRKRREYPNGIVFAPNKDVPGAYNHWQGFSVQPFEGKSPDRGCRLFLKHLLEIACNGDEALYRYHLGWLAHMIQKPEEKPGVAVVYKGRKRIGKDTVFEYVGRLFEHHYVTVANQDQMLGKFNAHQEKCLLLHMQEGFWAGSKQAEGMLKYLITSNQVMIEPKGMNAFPIPSVLRLFISSNEKWVIPASEDEGRFFVLNVSEKRRNDHEYFGALRAEMDGEGPSALLAYLQQYDISGFQVRAVPDTEALAEQKVQGLKNVERWWLDVLQRGQMDGIQNREDGIDGAVWGHSKVRIECSEFRENYSRWMRSRRYDGEEVSEIEFGIRMKKMCSEIERKQIQVRGRNTKMYILPLLNSCRTGFEGYIGSDIHWPESDEVIVEDDDL